MLRAIGDVQPENYLTHPVLEKSPSFYLISYAIFLTSTLSVPYTFHEFRFAKLFGIQESGLGLIVCLQYEVTLAIRCETSKI